MRALPSTLAYLTLMQARLQSFEAHLAADDDELLAALVLAEEAQVVARLEERGRGQVAELLRGVDLDGPVSNASAVRAGGELMGEERTSADTR